MTESEKNLISSGEQEKNIIEVMSQNWKDELMVVYHRLATLEGVSQTSTIGIVSSS